MTKQEEIASLIVKALGELEQIPVELSEKPHTTMMEALTLVKNLDIQRVMPRFSEITAESDDKAFSWILKDKRNAVHPENNSDMIRRLVYKYNDIVKFLNRA